MRWLILSLGAGCVPPTSTVPGTTSVPTSSTTKTFDVPRRPYPQHTVYAGAHTLPSGKRAALDEAVAAAYDRWKERWLTCATGSRTCRVLYDEDPEKSGTVSEGQGYGMVIAATMAGYDPDARQIFDGLWAFAQRHPSDLDDRLMDWHVPPDGAAEDDDSSAFDGDADISYALLLAYAQWGDPVYLDGALQVVGGLTTSALGPESRLPMLGDWVEPEGKDYNQYTVRTSDFMPTHFRAFDAVTRTRAWALAVDEIHARIDQVTADWAPDTGLLPDFVVPVPALDTLQPAPPGFLEAKTDGAYAYNAGRVPWRLGADALLHDDATSRAQAVAIAQWMESAAKGDPRAIHAGYELSGTPLPTSKYFTTLFAAPVGVAAMSMPEGAAWVDALWSEVVDAEEGYYEDSVALQCLIVMSGNAWAP